MDSNLLNLLIFLPLLGAVWVSVLRGESRVAARWIASLTSLAALGLAIYLFCRFDPETSAYQFVIRKPWVTSLGIQYYVGLDGVTLLLVLLTAQCNGCGHEA